jgi:hypothetical protein
MTDLMKHKNDLQQWLIDHDETHPSWKENMNNYKKTCEILNATYNDHSQRISTEND